MNRRLLLVFLVVAALLFSWAIPRLLRPGYAQFPPSNRGQWVAFGDSLTAGYGAVEGSDYPSVLAQRLGRPIQNLGVSGNTTADGLQRMDQVIALKPAVVLLCLGGNDALQGLPFSQTFNNLEQIIERLQAGGSFVVLIGVRSASIFDKYQSRFKSLARKKKIFYVENILDGVLTHPSLMSDQVHPNEAGYAHVAERLAGELRPLLPKLENPPAP